MGLLKKAPPRRRFTAEWWDSEAPEGFRRKVTTLLAYSFDDVVERLAPHEEWFGRRNRVFHIREHFDE